MTNAIQEINEMAAANAVVVQERYGSRTYRERIREERKRIEDNLTRAREEAERAERETIELLQRLREEEITEYRLYYSTSFKEPLMLALATRDRLIRNSDGSWYREQTNIVITSPTQNGKTGEIIDIVKNAGNNSLSILSCDNRKDQLNQLIQRFLKSGIFVLTCDDVEVSTGGYASPESIQKFKEYFNSHKKLVFILLNNNVQCCKATAIMKSVLNDEFFGIKKIYAIHDEADLINKHDNGGNMTGNVAKSHQEWIAFFNMLKPYTQIEYFKRIWVSATPENCVIIKNVKAKNVFVLPRNINYRNEIRFTVWCENPNAISREVERIFVAESREIILICSDYIKGDQAETSKLLFGQHKCPVITYNCDGIVLYNIGRSSPERFTKKSIDQVIGGINQSYNGAIIIVGNCY